jgi:hypothetical protein
MFARFCGRGVWIVSRRATTLRTPDALRHTLTIIPAEIMAMIRFALLVVLLLALAIAPATSAWAASSSRQRAYHSEHSIREILILLSVGLIDERARGELLSDVDPNRLEEFVAGVAEKFRFDEQEVIELVKKVREEKILFEDFQVDRVELRVDGVLQTERRAGVLLAIKKLVGFLFDKVQTGSVQLNYRIRLRNLTVLRETFVQDGRVRLTTSVSGAIAPLTSATLVSDAVETGTADSLLTSGKTTCIRNTISACAPYGRCPRGPVTRVVERVMDRRIDELLCRIETKAVGLARAGKASLVALSEAFILEIQNGLQ